MEHAEHQPALPLRRSLLLAAAAFLVCISVIEVVGGLHAIDASWLPSDSGSANLPSVGPWMPHAAARWVYLVRWEALWSLGVFGLVLVLLTIPGQHASRVAAALVLAQAVLLCVFLSVRIPLNGDQYAYVGFADLVLQGYNPYDPPLKRSARISNQLREISTVWGIVNEGATDATRRVIVRDRYGPAWTIGMAAVLYPFRNAGVEVQAHVVRAVAALAALGCSVLLWVSFRGLSWRGGALAAFALNPMIISQTAIGGHNDIIALLFGLGTYVAAM